MAKKLSLKPLGDRILVRPTEKEGEKRLASGIILPEAADKERPMKGEVIAVGIGRYEDGKRVPMQMKVGDVVIFNKHGYENGGVQEVKMDGQEHYILSELNILAIIS